MRALSAVLATALSMTGVAVTATAARAGDGGVPAVPLHSRTRGPVPSDVTDPGWLHATVSAPDAGVADVTLPASGWARAGDLPVYVATSGQASPVSVRVQVFDQAVADALGARFFVVRVTRTDGSRYEAPLSLRLGYAGVRRAFGGDFAARLYLARVDACVLSDPSCASPVAVPSYPDLTADRLVADVVAEPDPTAAPTADPLPGIGPSVYPMSSGGTAQTGDYKASPLPLSDRWQVGPSSGGFSYSYPIPTPPSLGGPAPSLSLDYSSQSVDGRTAAQNSQPSQVGEGWSLETGYVERRFKSCGDDGAGSAYTGNLCWSAPVEYYLHFGGRSGEIVQSASTNEWRLRDDPAWRIQSWTGTTNGDNDGEYFTLMTPDGTKYWFGLGTEPRNTPTRYTNSTLTVPVLGNNSGEPCYNAVPAAAFCAQAWRWNLDRVQDPATNIESLFYAKETNYYDRDNTAVSLVAQYDRASEPTRIEYGKRSGSESAAAAEVVTFTTAHRCAAQSACPAATPSNGTLFPDVPNDLICTSSASCPGSGQTSPSFFSTEEITRVTTYVLNSGGGLSDVDAVDLAYSFPVTDENTDPSLWLRTITRSGTYGGSSVALPSVLLAGTHYANRVDNDPAHGVPATNKYRVTGVVSETGGQTTVTYGQAHPCAVPFPAWDTNATDCFPQYFKPTGAPAGWGGFRTYLVTQTYAEDLVGSAPPRTTTYAYNDTPAWHYVNSLTTPTSPVNQQSWSDYRGYAKVTVVAAGDAFSDAQTTRYYTYRGMNGDRLGNGTAKSVSVTDEAGNAFTDSEYLAGHVIESDVFSPWGTWFQSKQHRYWASQTLPGPSSSVSWSAHGAYYVRESLSSDRRKDTSSANTGWHAHQVDSTYSTTYGVLTSSYDHGDGAVDDACRKLTYTVVATTASTPSAETWLLDVPYTDKTVAGACTGSTWVANTDLYYDGSVSLGAAPTLGRVTQTDVWTSTTAKATTKTAYDGYNRVVSVVAPNAVADGSNVATRTTYTPSTGFPYTSVVVTNPLGHTTNTKLEPGWSAPVQVTDANGNTTTLTRDPLGRITAVQRPGDTASAPSTRFTYVVAQGSPSRIATDQLLTGSTYTTAFTYYDGFGEPIESHAQGPNGGRVVSLTRYDVAGHARLVSAPFYNAGAIGTGVVNPNNADIPNATGYDHDSAGRVTDTITMAKYDRSNPGAVNPPLQEQWRTTVTHFETSDLATYPVHSAVTTDFDVFGRPVDVIERPSGTQAVTSYSYSRRGDLTSVVDAAGNTWTYGYDLAGHRLSSSDPDRGAWAYTYDADGNVATERDALLSTVTYAYDALDRRLSATSGGATLASWTYDNAAAGANGLGRPYTATKNTGGAAYTTRTDGYDVRGRPSGVTYVIPSAEGALAGSYAYGFGYDSADHRTSVTYPAVGSLLAAETVTTAYSAAGYPTTLSSGLGTYVSATSYLDDGRLSGRQLGSAADGVSRSYGYDVTRRLVSLSAAAAHAGVTSTVADDTLSYDDDGNVTRDWNAVGSQNECFRYEDGLDRLTRAYTSVAGCAFGAPGADPYDVTYAYNAVGNTTSVVDGGPISPVYPAAGAARPHAMTGYGTTTLTYDGNGAVATRTSAGVAWTFGYDALHVLTSISAAGSVASFVTDASGKRLVRHGGDGSATLYLDGMEVTAAGGALANATRYYGPATRVAAGADAGLWWTLGNQQHSATVTVNAATGAVRAQRYRPYGGHRNTSSTLPTPHGFLDKTEDPGGLDNLDARLYDPALGQFTTPDPLVDPSRPQTLNPYAYSLHNPATFSDPSGLAAITGDGVGTGDDPCAQAHDCDRKAAQEIRERDLIRASWQLPGMVAWQGENVTLVLGGYGGILTPTERAMAGNRHELTDQLWSEGGPLLDAFLKLYIATLGVGAVAGGVAAASSAGALAAATAATTGGAEETDLLAVTEGASSSTRSVNEILNSLSEGEQGFVRTVPDEETLQSTFDELTQGGTPTTWKNYGGQVYELSDGTQIGLRATSSSGGATIDIRIPGQDLFKIHIG